MFAPLKRILHSAGYLGYCMIENNRREYTADVWMNASGGSRFMRKNISPQHIVGDVGTAQPRDFLRCGQGRSDRFASRRMPDLQGTAGSIWSGTRTWSAPSAIKRNPARPGASTAIMFAMTAIPRAWTPSSACAWPETSRRPRRYPPPDDGPVLLPYARARAPCDGGSGAAHRL